MAKFLCTAKDNTNPDPTSDRRGCYKKGYPILVKPDIYRPSRSECPPNMVFVCVPEVTEEQAEAYCASWEQKIDYSVHDANATNATYTVEVFGSNLNISGEAAITKAQVENFLVDWNCTVDSFAANSVTFTMALWQALQSKGFWGMLVDNFTFILDNYDSNTGIADVTVSGLVVTENVNQVAHAKRLVEQKGCAVLSETTTSVTFAAERSDIFEEFKSDVKQKVQRTWCRKQYYFSEAVVDQALANLDTFDGETQLTWKGQIELTQAEALAALNNKLDE